MIRVWDTVFSGLAGGPGPRMRAVLLGLGIVTALVGAAMALAQTQLKRMLAFVTMSHLGITSGPPCRPPSAWRARPRR